MSSVALRLPASISHRLASATILIPALLVLSAATSPPRELLFFRATEDSEQYARDPGRYDRASFSSTPVGDTMVVYVERQPTLRVPLSDIRSVTVEKKRFYKNKSLEDAVLEALGKKKKDTSEEGAEYYYDVTFRLRPNAGRQIAKLSHRETFDLRLGNDRLSIGHFTRRAAGNIVDTLAFPLIETDPQRIRAILSPLKDRVTWK
jgi:hypothetical protein